MSTTRSIANLLILSTLALGLTACADEAGTTPPAAEESARAPQFPADLFVDAAPTGAVHVFDLKQDAKEGDVVTVRGRIGGSGQPFVESRAALTIADTQGNITNCSDKPDDSCPTPWDYCCDPPNVIMANTATVQVVDADGRPLKLGLEGAGGLEKSGFIVVTGTVGPRPDTNVLVINATAIHVE